MKISEKRKAGEILERGGLSQRIITIANEIAKGTYKEAMENAGRIAELCAAATYDDYWTEKVTIGRYKEHAVLRGITTGEVTKETVICNANGRA